MDTILLIIVSALNLVGGFFIGTWYCKYVRGMK